MDRQHDVINQNSNELHIIFWIYYLMEKKTLGLISLLACIAVIALISSEGKEPTTREVYEEWKNQHNVWLKYTPEQDAFRFKIFERNLKEINEHNAKPDETYKMGVNQFTALTKEQFKESYLSDFAPNPNYIPKVETSSLQLNVDWVSFGAVSPVKNEGSCKANWAFSAVGAIEGISVIVYKQQQEYSAQELVDCSFSYGNNGCVSGTMVNSFNFILTRGLNTESAYPYVARQQSCQSTSGLFRIKGSGNVTSCTNLDYQLTKQPISVAVDGNNMVSYRSGLFSNCGTSLSVAALLVSGYDTYYRLKMSWGTAWGEAGYIRLSKLNNVCGICMAASYPNA